ncbi:MAG TPA: acyl-CoA dehydrogenase family protein [Ktedonobacteraceae bacterium]|nr:acyl-CoA dehydrogenase family protein [Ktedonobacteraceae bacterium]
MTIYTDSSIPGSLTYEEALSRAKSIAVAVRERASDAEQLRRQPDENIAAFVQAGLLRLLLPSLWGGYELSFDTAVDTILEIARGDASAGWCYAILVFQPWLLAYFPEQAQREVWGEQADATLAAAVFPAGRFQRTQGGFQLSGNWAWMSGIDHSQWIITMAMPAEMDGPPQLFLIPNTSYKILDTWFVTGLKASGSKNALVENIFVPEHRAMPFPALFTGKAPGAFVNKGPNYQLPMLAAFPIGLVAPILGATRGAFEIWCEANRNKLTGITRERVSTMTHQQILLAELASEIDMAELTLRHCLTVVKQGSPIPLDALIRLRRDYAAIAKSCVHVIEQIYLHSGGSANYESHPIQRYWRDIHAMASHAALNFDTIGESYGRFQLGLTSNPNDSVRF